MTAVRTGRLKPQPAPRVSWSAGLVTLRDAPLFGAGRGADRDRFLARVFRLGEVRSVVVDHAAGAARVRHDLSGDGAPGFLRRLAAAVRDESEPSGPTAYARRSRRGAATEYVRAATDRATVLELDRPGRLRLGARALVRNPPLAEKVERLLDTMPGVRRVSADPARGRVVVRYDEAALNPAQVRRLVESVLAGPDVWGLSLPEPESVKFGAASATLGVAVVGQFAAPAVLPVCAFLLVATNLRTFRAAWLQFRHRRCGLPVLYTTIVVTSLASGQYVSSALMAWFFRYWHRRYRRELTTERYRLLDGCIPLAASVRLVRPGGVEVLVGAGRLKTGDHVAVSAGEPVSADGRVVDGEAVVDERSLRGLDGVSRKRAGDAVLAGSVVVSGEFRMVVERPVGLTRAKAIGRALVASTSPMPGSSAPTRRSEAFAERVVGPTLATAGLGFLVGDLHAVGAILRADYATGPGLGVPLDTLRDVAYCARRGLVVRDPGVFARLREASLLVLDDLPALRFAGVALDEVRTDRPDAEVLRYAASAFRLLDDPRAAALREACLDRRVHRLDLAPVDFTSGVTVLHGKLKVRVRELKPGSGELGPLGVDVDGAPAGELTFRRAGKPDSASVVRRLRELGVGRVALLSDRSPADAAPLAAHLGANTLRTGLDPDGQARFLRECRARGVKTAYVGDCRRNALAASEAHVAVSLSGEFGHGAEETGPEAAAVLGDRPDRLEVLWEVARSHAGSVRLDHAMVIIPNLACIAGALFFGFTGLTTVLVSNLGTYGVYSRAAGELRALEKADRARLKLPDRHRQPD